MSKVGRNFLQYKEKDIYKWVKGRSGDGTLIVNQGGSAQIKDIMKLAEETWGRTLGNRCRRIGKIPTQTYGSNHRR